MLVANPDPSPIKGFAAGFADEPDKVGFARSTLVMPASEGLSPNQLEARIEVYAELVRQGRPLFEDGPAGQDEDPRYRCWGCGISTPKREDGSQMMSCKTPGWVIGQITALGVQGKSTSGIWCPSCAAMPGFGCVEEEEPDESPISLQPMRT